MDRIGSRVSAVEVVLRKTLGDFNLDVEWSAPSGFIVLFGYSGAGKSITLSMISGTMRPDSGRVVIDGAVFSDSDSGVFLSPQERRIGLVSQVADLFPHLTVRANIEYGLFGLSKAERSARVGEMLEAFRITDLRDKRPGQISGGQYQRAALARAMAPSPRVLLLDEPLSALALPIRLEMRELLLSVQRDFGIPVVLVTHDLSEALALADTMVVYSGTGVVQIGRPQEILDAPLTPEIARLLSHVGTTPESMLRVAAGTP